MLVEVIEFLFKAAASGIAGNRADALAVRLAVTNKSWAEQLGEAVSSSVRSSMDKRLYTEWLRDPAVERLLAGGSGLPSAEMANALLEGLARHSVVPGDPNSDTWRRSASEVAAASLMLFATVGSDELRRLASVFVETAALKQGQATIYDELLNQADSLRALRETFDVLSNGAMQGPASQSETRAGVVLEGGAKVDELRYFETIIVNGDAHF